MDRFTKELHNQTNFTKTENGAIARETTNSYLLNFFAQGGALRERESGEINRLFDKAWNEDQLHSLRTLFYFRDIRGGQGERRTFRLILKYLANIAPETVKKNLEHIPFYGRWDDLYSLFDTDLESFAARLMKKQFLEDMDSNQPSLLAKWMKSENASSPETRRLARKTIKHFGWSPSKYRKAISKLREKIRVVEKHMSENMWKEINYSQVPSKAAMNYKDAFMRHDPKRYQKYLDDLAKGETKINASTLFPYEILRAMGDLWYPRNMEPHEIRVLNEQWKALPDYIQGSDKDMIVVADTSGSMEGLPILVSVSLAIYCAERIQGRFKNKFVTFSEQPKLQDVIGTTIVDKARNLSNTHWNQNTNIEAVFDLFLKIAVKEGLLQKELPSRILIVSDMEFDYATGGGYWCSLSAPDKTLFQKIEGKYRIAGYKMPKLIFWNVNSRNDQFPMSMDDRGFQLVSGCSPAIFKALMTDEFLEPYSLMLSVIDSERYQRITI